MPRAHRKEEPAQHEAYLNSSRLGGNDENEESRTRGWVQAQHVHAHAPLSVKTVEVGAINNLGVVVNLSINAVGAAAAAATIA